MLHPSLTTKQGHRSEKIMYKKLHTLNVKAIRNLLFSTECYFLSFFLPFNPLLPSHTLICTLKELWE